MFLAYLIGGDTVIDYVTGNPLDNTSTLISLLIFTGVFYFIFAWFREQVCIIACPYGRLQGVLLDNKTINVAYDHVRGEGEKGRAKFKKKEDREASGKGDCIDCFQCVNVCPTGIDIRNGTQLECVNCTACIDACDEMMDRVDFDRGLIRYTSENDIEKGEKYFYEMLTDLSDIKNITQEDFIDWGEEEKYVKAIGIGECAGVVIDLIATLFLESEEKIDKAKEAFDNKMYSNAIYHAYSSLVNSAKAMLLSENKKTNTQAGIIKQFDEVFVESNRIELGNSFSTIIYQIKQHAPTKEFALNYIKSAEQFLLEVKEYRSVELIK